MTDVQTEEHKCKSCGTPMDEVPFDQCIEHEEWDKNNPEQLVTLDEAMDIAYQEAMDEAYRYGN